MIGFGVNSSAEDITTRLQKSCIQEQLNEHKEVKTNPIRAEDFKPYCKCESNFITKNATETQLNELKAQPKTKSQWLGELQQKAFKSCLGSESKTNT
jgi:hypothetical protein